MTHKKKEYTKSQTQKVKSSTRTHVIISNVLNDLFTIIGSRILQSLMATFIRPLKWNLDKRWFLCKNLPFGLLARIVLSITIHSLHYLDQSRDL